MRHEWFERKYDEMLEHCLGPDGVAEDAARLGSIEDTVSVLQGSILERIAPLEDTLAVSLSSCGAELSGIVERIVAAAQALQDKCSLMVRESDDFASRMAYPERRYDEMLENCSGPDGVTEDATRFDSIGDSVTELQGSVLERVALLADTITASFSSHDAELCNVGERIALLEARLLLRRPRPLVQLRSTRKLRTSRGVSNRCWRCSARAATWRSVSRSSSASMRASWKTSSKLAAPPVRS